MSNGDVMLMKKARGAALLNLSRAAELVGQAYRTIANAADDGRIESIDVEGAGGKITRIVTYTALRNYRNRLVKASRMQGTAGAVRFANELEKKDF